MSVIAALAQHEVNARIEANAQKLVKLRGLAIFTAVTGVLTVLLAVILPILHFAFGFSDIFTIAKIIAPLTFLSFINISIFMKKAYK